MKIGPVGSDLFRACRQTDMATLIVSFRNFSYVPSKPRLREGGIYIQGYS